MYDTLTSSFLVAFACFDTVAETVTDFVNTTETSTPGDGEGD